MKQFSIVKATGDVAPFSEEKYRRSLSKSGATDSDIDLVLEKIQPILKNRMTTRELYKITYRQLGKMHLLAVGGRYHLREAIRKLGPSGFPFERYYAELLKTQGYSVLVDTQVKGRCVLHEIDVIATKGHERLIIECKFHADHRTRSSIQTALYVKARYDDVKAWCDQDPTCKPKFTDCWLVTNTKLSSVAIDYGECVGLKLLGWSYPENKGLEKIIDKSGLHPITCLSSLPKKIIGELFNHGIVFCHDIKNKVQLLKQMNLKESKIKIILEECAAICKKEGHPYQGGF